MSHMIVEHKGIITKITPKTISVEITVQSACAHCEAKNSCQAFDSQNKTIELVPTTDQINSLKINDSVTVAMTRNQGFIAVFFSFILPLILLLVVLIIANILFKNDGISALAALLSLVPYYFVIYLVRNKFKTKFEFKLKD